VLDVPIAYFEKAFAISSKVRTDVIGKHGVQVLTAAIKKDTQREDNAIFSEPEVNMPLSNLSEFEFSSKTLAEGDAFHDATAVLTVAVEPANDCSAQECSSKLEVASGTHSEVLNTIKGTSRRYSSIVGN